MNENSSPLTTPGTLVDIIITARNPTMTIAINDLIYYPSIGFATMSGAATADPDIAFRSTPAYPVMQDLV